MAIFGRKWVALALALVTVLVILGVCAESCRHGPMFSTLRLGERGWSWRKNLLRDAQGRLVLIDAKLNLVSIVSPGMNDSAGSIVIRTGKDETTFEFANGDNVRVPSTSNGILIVSAGKGLRRTNPMLRASFSDVQPTT